MVTTAQQEQIIATTILTCCALSVAGGIFIILCYKMWKKRHGKGSKEIVKLSNEIILWIGISVLIDYSSELLGAASFLYNNGECYVIYI